MIKCHFYRLCFLKRFSKNHLFLSCDAFDSKYHQQLVLTLISYKMKLFLLQTLINKTVLTLNVLFVRLLFVCKNDIIQNASLVKGIMIPLETLRTTQVLFHGRSELVLID